LVGGLLLEERGDRLLSESIGKTISVYYNDTYNSVSFKVGKFLDFDLFSLKIMENEKKIPLLLPRDKCIRVEIEGGTKP